MRERRPREVSGEHRHDAGEHTDLPSHSQPMPTRTHSQRSAPPRRHAHSSSRSPHLRTPHHLSPLPSAAPRPARFVPPPGDPCRFAAPAPAVPAATNQGGHRRSGPSWLPPGGKVFALFTASGVRTATPTGTSLRRFVFDGPTRALLGLAHLTTPIRLPLASERLPHHSRRLRHQRTASQAAALTASSPTSQGQLLCTMTTIHRIPIAIRSRPTPHRSRLPGKERLESLIITISSKTANWILVSPRPTHRVTSLPLPPALSSLSSPRDASATAVCAGSVRSAAVVVVSASASFARSL